MAAKPKNQITPVVTITSALATAFMNFAESRSVEIHDIARLGKVGLKELSVGLRDEWTEIKNDSSIWLVQNTVCDPETGELVLKHIDVERLKEMPPVIFEELIQLIFKQNGFRTVDAVKNLNESDELKN